MTNITKKEFRKAVYLALSKTYVKALIENTPGDGQTHDNWDIKFNGNSIIIYNEPTGDNIVFTNYGTKPHIIRNKEKKALRWKVGAGDRFAFSKAVFHPGIQAMHYIERILEDKNLEKKCRLILESEIEKIIKNKINK